MLALVCCLAAGVNGSTLVAFNWRISLIAAFVSSSGVNIGAGKAGLALAAVQAKILLVERNADGGDSVGTEHQTAGIAKKGM